MNKLALFPGSFDPFTKGHLDTVERAAQMFEQVTVAIMTNTNKKSLFTKEEKLTLTQAALAHLPNVKVMASELDLTVNLARDLGATVLIRGIRNTTDYEYEKSIAHMNHDLAPEIETVFLLSPPALSQISSSLIKEITTFGGDVSAYLPTNIHQAVLSKYQQK
ncbi:pantetheine-phosphate adenylyltransferase [Vagococcus zengguangii]|uniref:Phosphopantetheine adenylyltransferase n=1 Tax=Vagococcus zengguangii TaxID=2571750 RepID=A0A4D7CUJ4_9ENTE|nr:pantetheine-phosphate adenylyltransferase [Vagococcus zengguangii]QCI86037.1 pantetheine-phosphate adenylyltransferase [Vagococcus zengguangii]